MFVMGNMIVAAARIIEVVLTLSMWIIIAQSLISWVNPDPYNPIVRFLYRVTEPVLAPIRRWASPAGDGDRFLTHRGHSGHLLFCNYFSSRR
jgi:YggT family protein